MAYKISEDMMSDIARALNEGATWAALSRVYGIPAPSLKRAYLRKSGEVYGKPAPASNGLSPETQALLKELGLA